MTTDIMAASPVPSFGECERTPLSSAPRSRRRSLVAQTPFTKQTRATRSSQTPSSVSSHNNNNKDDDNENAPNSSESAIGKNESARSSSSRKRRKSIMPPTPQTRLQKQKQMMQQKQKQPCSDSSSKDNGTETLETANLQPKTSPSFVDTNTPQQHPRPIKTRSSTSRRKSMRVGHPSETTHMDDAAGELQEEDSRVLLPLLNPIPETVEETSQTQSVLAVAAQNQSDDLSPTTTSNGDNHVRPLLAAKQEKDEMLNAKKQHDHGAMVSSASASPATVSKKRKQNVANKHRRKSMRLASRSNNRSSNPSSTVEADTECKCNNRDVTSFPETVLEEATRDTRETGTSNHTTTTTNNSEERNQQKHTEVSVEGSTDAALKSSPHDDINNITPATKHNLEVTEADETTPPRTDSKKPVKSILRSNKARGSKPASSLDVASKSLFGKTEEPAARENEWISASAVTERAMQLFNTPPCVSASIFSCFSMIAEKKNEAINFQAILPLSKAFVKAELVSLQEVSSNEQNEKSVQFCTYDSSSTQPPVDRIEGSDETQEESINALRDVKIELDGLLNDQAGRDVIKKCLESIVDFLKTDYWHAPIATATNTTIRRVEKAAISYRGEFGAALMRMNGSESPLFAEKRFAELVGQSIRYHLRWLLRPAPPRLTKRLLLRPAPPRLTTADEDYSNWSQRYSQVNKRIAMVPREGTEEADEEKLAALFTRALDHLCEYFGLDFLTQATFTVPSLPQSFFNNPSSQQSIPKNGGVAMCEGNLQNVYSDIDAASSVVTLSNACNFLHQLLSLDTVQEEIERQGGWAGVETFATYSWMYDLWKLCPEDKHLVPLFNYEGFFKRLSMIVKSLKEPTIAAKKGIASLTKRFRLKATARSIKLHAAHPEIRKLAECLKEHNEHANVFPTITEVETDEQEG